MTEHSILYHISGIYNPVEHGGLFSIKNAMVVTAGYKYIFEPRIVDE